MRSARPGEDNFAHSERVVWLLGHLPPGTRAVEVGCGTGWGVTLPLRLAGRDVVGVDLDEASIEYGKPIFDREGADSDALRAVDLAELPERYDAVIASELFEHLRDRDLAGMLDVIKDKLVPGGILLATVPNGYGWYEAEAALWARTGLGWLIRRSGLAALIRRARLPFVAGATWSEVPNTLSGCPHVQRFTLRGLKQTLTVAGFEVVDARGSVLVCGPFTELLFSGARRVQRLNGRLARRFPAFSSGFYVAATLPRPPAA